MLRVCNTMLDDVDSQFHRLEMPTSNAWRRTAVSTQHAPKNNGKTSRMPDIQEPARVGRGK